MVDGKETKNRVVQDLYVDPRLATIKGRCRVMYELQQRGRGYTRAEYDDQCATLPYDGYPWPD